MVRDSVGQSLSAYFDWLLKIMDWVPKAKNRAPELRKAFLARVRCYASLAMLSRGLPLCFASSISFFSFSCNVTKL